MKHKRTPLCVLYFNTKKKNKQKRWAMCDITGLQSHQNCLKSSFFLFLFLFFCFTMIHIKSRWWERERTCFEYHTNMYDEFYMNSFLQDNMLCVYVFVFKSNAVQNGLSNTIFSVYGALVHLVWAIPKHYLNVSQCFCLFIIVVFWCVWQKKRWKKTPDA